jgi:hypothetical protein
MFERWSVDLDTLQPDPDWTTEVNGVEIVPAGNTDVATVTAQNLLGESSTRDLHVNVREGEAFWFVASVDPDCPQS